MGTSRRGPAGRHRTPSTTRVASSDSRQRKAATTLRTRSARAAATFPPPEKQLGFQGAPTRALLITRPPARWLQARVDRSGDSPPGSTR
jgi:hypothetical protein